MNEYSYWFFWAMTTLQMFACGYIVGSVGKPREPFTKMQAVWSMVLAVMYLLAALYMVRV